MNDGYLVAQIGDLVRIDNPGPLFGTFGEVIDQRPDYGSSVTARICTVRLDGGPVIDVSADLLEVLP
jgi:hypothetical protein